MKKIIIPFMLLIIVIGGCNTMEKSDDNGKPVNGDTKLNNQEGMNEYEKENYVPVQDYIGEGYTLKGAREETGEIAKEHRDEVEKAVEDFFVDEYKTEVNVHNFVSAKDGVSVFVESTGEPHFYSFAIVPVDIKNKEVKTDQVWSQEGQVEAAIQGGLYAMAFEEEFQNLEEYVEEITEDYPVVGRNIEGIANVGGNGYTTPYYSVTPFSNVFDDLLDRYIENPYMSKSELKNFFEVNEFDRDKLTIIIEFFMSSEEDEPDSVLFNKITSDIEKMDTIPRGKYGITLNDNYIDKKRAIGTKDNSLELLYPNEILKE